MDRTRNAPICIALTALTVTAWPLPARAVDRTWTNAAGGSFYGFANWSPLGWPTASDTAIFDMTVGGLVVMGSGTTSNERLLVPGGDVVIDLNNQTYELTESVLDSVIAGNLAQSAGLTLRTGRFESRRSFIGVDSASTGAVELSLAHWTVHDVLYVGDSGTGVLGVLNGSSLLTMATVFIGNLPGSDGTVHIGDGSTLTSAQPILVGSFGTGVLTVDGGATATTDSLGIAQTVNGTGSVFVTGAGTSLASTTMRVGSSGVGSAEVTGGATLTTSGADIGWNPMGDGEMRIGNPGTTWTDGGSLSVGLTGTGTLTVFDLGEVAASFVKLGDVAGSSGSLTVTSGGSFTTTSNLLVGVDGDGSMLVDGGGLVSSTSLATIADGADSVSQVTVDGASSSWTNAGPVTVGDAGQGTLTLRNGGRLVAESVFVNAASRVEGNGVLEAWVQSSGTVSPGESAGQLTVDASVYIQTATGVLEIELGGTVPIAEHDVLDVSGDAFLSGALDVALIDGFTPADGDLFRVLHAMSVNGQFDTLNLPPLAPGLRWEVDQTGGVQLQVVATCLTDCAQPPDGAVNVVDLLALLASWGQDSPCDSDGTAPIGVVDLLALLAEWGACP